ncbi:Tellurite resistance protein TerB [Bernardetia litoralis DSM 6794]|uniref:Tellurite resistance protein TerB n=1 Tax=Bernardetia litoralis (strain ATCC 23117 / DSM 6794 / NBRC 15988 / NCIMB 1366 / Fx l1 / Sio-4) TaxID=880071 RepID=I4AQK4_BERLS|nr:TerB family tellurite resistance protein [Bernardetia litoralis]AFM06239.1 Tellurite resistance protein TerB [Bernardetia litoralis DSM 6794]
MNKERLYDAFGELIYTLAMADGLIQAEELQALDRILKGHPWASQIKWSFDYEANKALDLQDVYKKALNTFAEHGQDKEYTYLIDILQEVAKASDRIDTQEQKMIERFQQDLRENFITEMERRKLV